MNRFYTLLLLLFSSSFLITSLYAQDRCPYQGPQQPANYYSTTVGNFTITDTEGNLYDLYETLDSGMTVFVDLFFTRCTYCQQYAGIIEQIYQNTGAGTEDILMWGISNDPYDTNPIIDQYRTDYGISNPCAGPQGGGTTAHTTVISGQNFLGWPTYCVICPDRTMYFDPVYPPTVSGFNPYFEQCAAVVGIDEPHAGYLTMLQAIYPNPARDHLNIEFSLDMASSAMFEIYDLTGSRLMQQEYQAHAGKGSFTIDLSALSSGYYFLKFSQNGVFKEARRVIVQ